jgi:hypothetical protein
VDVNKEELMNELLDKVDEVLYYQEELGTGDIVDLLLKIVEEAYDI